MAVTLTGANGLFTRLGKILYVAEQVKAAQATIATEWEDVLDEYSSADLFMLTGNLSIPQAQIEAGALYSRLQAMAQATLIEMVDADTPLPTRTLDAALTELIEQMETNGDSINGYSAAGGVTATNPSGDNKGALLWSVVDGNGNVLQHLRNETVTIRASVDAQTGAVGSGYEVFTVTGPARVSDIRSPDWGTGSGVNLTIRTATAAKDGGRAANQNLLTNSTFDTFTTTNTADNWTYHVGTPGTEWLEEGTVKFRGDKCLEIAGDGATLVSVSQALNTTGATVGRLRPLTRYAIAARCRVSATGTGVVRFSVKDGSDNILDSGSAATTASMATFSTTAFQLTWTTFSTPADIPDGTKFVIEATTAIENAKSMFIDEVLLVELTQMIPGGPFIAIVPGSADFVVGSADAEFTLAYGADLSSSNKFVYWLDRFFGMADRPKTFPVDLGGSETVADSLVA